MKSLIVGFATNLSPSAATIFLRSARAVHPTSEVDIVLITNDTLPLAKLAREASAELVRTTSTYGRSVGRTERYARRILIEVIHRLSKSRIFNFSPEFAAGYFALMETWQHPHITRWNAYRDLLKFRQDYEYVALCDVRDVVFQDYIFCDIPADCVMLSKSSELMSENDSNSRWIIQAFGKKFWRNHKNKAPLCVGVIIGPGRLVHRMVNEFHTVFYNAPFGKVEQALFNRMYFENRFDVQIRGLPNGDRIATLDANLIEDVATHQDGTILDRESMRPYPVVHMYDRFSHINDLICKRFL